MVVANILAWCLVLAATELPTLEVAWDVDRVEAAPGDTISVTLRAGWDGDRGTYTLRPPTPDPPRGLALGPTSTTQRLGAGRTQWVYTYRLVPTKPGNLVLPPMRLQYLARGSETWEETASQELSLSIREGKRGSRGARRTVVVLGAVAVGLAVAGSALYARHRRKRRSFGLDPLAQAALDRVAILEGTRDNAAFCQGISAAVRSYLEQKLRVDLRGKATSEALLEVKQLLPAVHWHSVREVLEACDRGRFGSIGDGETRSRILRNCRALLTGERAHED